MSSYVILRLPSGGHCQLRPGDQIGRHHRCELHLVDQRISEAHAMVALRGGTLRLLGLRGGLAVDGQLVRDPILEAGMTFELAPGLPIEVREVHLAGGGLALTGPGLRPVRLGGTLSLFVTPRVETVQGYRPGASAWLHDDGEQWFCSTSRGLEGPLDAGDVVRVDGWEGELVWRSLDPPEQATLDPYRADRSLRIEAWYDSVRVFQDHQMLLHISGKQGRLLSELVQLGQPVDWHVVASEVWTDIEDRMPLRRRWDTTLRRLRRALSDAGIRSDLLISDGRGRVSIIAYPADELVLKG